MKDLYFVTSNEDKVKEAKKILDNYKIKQKKLDYPEIQAKIEEVAKEGAKWSYEEINTPLFVEDSGLFIKTLNGFPGPFSSFVFEKLGNRKIMDLMNKETNRKAFFKSVIAYTNGKEIKLFEGKVRGSISEKIRGKHGFGFDPVFIPEEKSKTFGEMIREEKNKYSHRRKVLSNFSKYLDTKNI